MTKIEVGKTYKTKLGDRAADTYDVLMAHVNKEGVQGFVCYVHSTRGYTLLIGNLCNYEEVHVPVITYSYNTARSCSRDIPVQGTIWSANRYLLDNVKATFRDGVLTSVEMIKPPIIPFGHA